MTCLYNLSTLSNYAGLLLHGRRAHQFELLRAEKIFVTNPVLFFIFRGVLFAKGQSYFSQNEWADVKDVFTLAHDGLAMKVVFSHSSKNWLKLHSTTHWLDDCLSQDCMPLLTLTKCSIRCCSKTFMETARSLDTSIIYFSYMLSFSSWSDLYGVHQRRHVVFELEWFVL